MLGFKAFYGAYSDRLLVTGLAASVLSYLVYILSPILIVSRPGTLTLPCVDAMMVDFPELDRP
jgi:hypothetical protein